VNPPRFPQRFPANTPTSTPKYADNFRIICRLNGFLPESTSEIVDFGISVAWCTGA
jgi:hypothetical protein